MILLADCRWFIFPKTYRSLKGPLADSILHVFFDAAPGLTDQFSNPFPSTIYHHPPITSYAAATVEHYFPEE